MGTVVPIELVSHQGSRISIGYYTFITYGSSITRAGSANLNRSISGVSA